MSNGRGHDLRVGDSERQEAMRLLGEHLTAGRLDITEYDDRCRNAAEARFRSNLSSLFEDLPKPRPEAMEPRPATNTSRRTGQRAGSSVGKVAMIICVAALGVVLVVVARQLGLVLLLPLIAVLWFSTRR